MICRCLVPTGQVKKLRSRNGLAGNKGARSDAYLLADVIGTARHRPSPLTRSTPATLAPRGSVRVRSDLVEHRVATAHQLRAHLQIVFPAVADLLAALDSAVSLSFLDASPARPRRAS